MPNREESGAVAYLSNVVPVLIGKLQHVDANITILSPYLTSDIAQKILAGKEPRQCEIYTLFSADQFAYGSSSLETIDQLSKLGYQLFHLPDLHAKVVLVTGEFAAIGSQNLTHSGLARKEATTVLTSAEHLDHIEQQIAEWKVKRRPITTEMIGEMKELLPPISKHFENGKNAASAADDLIWQNEQNRARRRLEDLRKAIKGAPKARSSVLTSVTWLDSGIWTLMPTGRGNLTQWQIDNENIVLDRIYWYLCMIEETGQLAWVRVTKTRITFIHDERSAFIKLGEPSVRCSLNFIATWDLDDLDFFNLMVVVKPEGIPGRLDGRLWFSLDSMKIRSLTVGPSSETQHDSRLIQLHAWIMENKYDVELKLVDAMLPRAYLSLQDTYFANKFFGNYGTRYALRLGKFHDLPVLIASQ